MDQISEIRPANPLRPTKGRAPDERGDQLRGVNQPSSVPAQPFADLPLDETQNEHVGEGEGRPFHGDHSASALPTLIALWRQRQDLARAHQRLDYQCQAVCRRYSDGDKDVAATRWAAIKRGGDDELLMVLMPYRMAMEPLEQAQHGLEKQLARMARATPLAAWAGSVRGVGELSLAGLYGEAGREFADFRSPAALWKRFGLAVIEGGRQRLVAGADALVHGYAPQRRAFAYVLSTSLMRSQGTDGPYRLVYDARKAYELAREIPKAQAHNRALRYMVKRLLKDAWRASRAVAGQPTLVPETPEAKSCPASTALAPAACPSAESPRPRGRKRPSVPAGCWTDGAFVQQTPGAGG